MEAGDYNKRLCKAYSDLFLQSGKLSENAKTILADLNHNCFASDSAFDPNPTTHARNEGRREVYCYIMKFLNVDISDLFEEQLEYNYQYNLFEGNQ